MGYIGAGPTRFNTADELTVTGDAEFNGNATFGDNDKAIFGAGSDLQIYHDGANSRIAEAGTGDLKIGTSGGAVRITANGVTDDMIVANQGGSVSLSHSGSTKLATTSTGVNITGGLNTTGSVGIGTSSPSELLGVNSTGASTAIEISAGLASTTTGEAKLVLRSLHSSSGTEYSRSEIASLGVAGGDSDLIFRTTSDASGPVEHMRIDSEGLVGIGTSSPARDLHINGTAANAKAFTRYTHDGLASTGLDVGYSSGGYASIYNAENTSMVFSTNATERMRIDSSGNVGINRTPTYELDVSPADNANSEIRIIAGSDSGADAVLRIQCTATAGTRDSAIYFGDSANTTIGRITYGHSNDDMRFFTNGTEKMRLNNVGRWWVGEATGTILNGNGAEAKTGMMHYTNTQNSFTVIQSNGSNAALYVTSGPNRTTAVLIQFGRNGSGVGSISTNGTTTAYNTSSDYRLKENVTADWDATTRLKQLNPVRFNFIADADTTVDGFLAHEVQDIVPEAITGTHNGMRDEEYQVSAATGDIYTPAIEAVLDEDGNEVTPAVAEVIHSTDVEQPEELAEGQQWRETTAAVMGTRSVPDYQGIDQSKLVPLLVKTIQELEARIVALETA